MILRASLTQPSSVACLGLVGVGMALGLLVSVGAGLAVALLAGTLWAALDNASWRTDRPHVLTPQLSARCVAAGAVLVIVALTAAAT